MDTKNITAKAFCIITRNDDEILAGIAHDDVKNESFGRLIGGGIEFGETSETAVRREFKEELNAEIENLEFVDIVENIFVFNGQSGHQITFVYKGTFKDKSLYEKEDFKILDSSGSAKWIPIQSIISGTLKLYPEMNYMDIIKSVYEKIY